MQPKDSLRPVDPVVPWAIEGRNLVRRFGQTIALNGVDLAVRPGEFFSLLGPSGCGKTTLLRLIAGLDQPDDGTLQIGGIDALPIPAHQRPVNTVFQSYALFPHLTVFDNVAFGLRMKRLARAQIEERVRRVMELVQITRLMERRPAQLSGGEKQRVALARAVVNEPRILLLDEPLGALDLKLRKELQIELHQLQRRLGITFLYVTHDQDEALSLSDRIAVLHAGRIEQLGSAQELYERPKTRFVAEFLGGCNLIEASGATGQTTVATACGKLVTGEPCRSGKFTLAIRPEKIVLDPPAGTANTLEAIVCDLFYSGSETQYLLETGTMRLKVAVLNRDGRTLFERGTRLKVALPPERLIFVSES